MSEPHLSETDVTVTFDFIEAMGTIAALRAVIESAPFPPDKLISAERKIVAASKGCERRVLGEPDVYEGNDEARKALCDHVGHDLDEDAPGTVCLNCGAEWSEAALSGPEGRDA